MAHTLLVRVLALVALTLFVLIGSVSSQESGESAEPGVDQCQTLDNTGVSFPSGSLGQPNNATVDQCQTLDNTGVVLPSGSVGQPSTIDECCIACQDEPDCSAALYEVAPSLCYLLEGVEIELTPNLVGDMVLVPTDDPDEEEAVPTGERGIASQEFARCGFPNCDLILVDGLRLPDIIGYIAACIFFLCVSASTILFFRERRRQKNRKERMPKYETV